MGICDSRKNESIQKGSDLIQNDKALFQASKSICKIETRNKMGSGFLIRFFKGEEKFFCLMTNEHIINKDMIERKETITFYFDIESESRDLILNSNERYIKTFRDINIDATVVEILPGDNIPINYFLKPNIDYMKNINGLIDKDITIIQYSSGVSSHSYGKIKSNKNYEFAYSASTLEGSSGSPIFLKYSPQVIGIHKEGGKIENYGDFIGPIFEYFKNYYKTDHNNDDFKKIENTKFIPEEKTIKANRALRITYDINKKNINKKLFKFQTGTGITKDVYIEPDKKIKDLIKLYFKQINQPELYKDKDIVILSRGLKIDQKSDKLISEFCEENRDVPIPVFVVIDVKSKIKNL